MLLYLIVKEAMTALTLQFDVFLDGEKILHHSIDFDSPFERVKLCMQYFVLFGLLKQLFLLLVARRVKKANLSLLDPPLRDLAAKVGIAGTAVLESGVEV